MVNGEGHQRVTETVTDDRTFGWPWQIVEAIYLQFLGQNIPLPVIKTLCETNAKYYYFRDKKTINGILINLSKR